ncbi:MAG: sodium-translocating pyrophosphatase, partial [Oscillospiraceae bacterium]|nr:sodium-translocating pyrophosphatase [Oscillospiraceae bacterium]
MENLYWIGFVGAALALVFAFVKRSKVMKASEGDAKMVKLASAIRQGANAYLKRQYKTVAIVFAIVFAILCAISFASEGALLSRITPFAFLTGGLWSMLAGLIGMKVATNSNARTANAARESLNKGLNIAFSSGAVMGFTVVGLGLLDISLWFVGLKIFGHMASTTLANTMVMNGMGASFMALFARVGGGIYTKAADVGADLVGKVEAGIPEDDPRNPATIADNVGDNVGDIAGMGADLYESYVGSILATFALGASAGYGWNGLILPIALAVVGVICSLIGCFLVKTKESATQLSLLNSLRTGTYTAAILSAVCAFPLCYFILGKESNWFGVCIAILCGLIGGCLIGYFTEYYTSDNYKPTKKLAAASETGTATIIIGGLSLGLSSTLASILVVAVAVLVAYFAAGGSMNILDATGLFTAEFNRGLYGISLAGVGMLSTLGITLATDAYGPVADNAGGIAEMAGLPEEVRERTDALDSLGNTTAATGKGFAIGSASLTALALLVSYVNIIQNNTEKVLNFNLTSPTVLVGMFIGAMLTFIFSASTMSAVQKAAQSIVREVRRQFKEIPGIMEYKADPDYSSCVDLCTKGALREMIVPALIAVIVPILTGLFIGCEGVVGLLGGVSVTGFAMAIFMSNTGGAWDNAKKYIERGNHGGKGSKQHKAAVVGDTVGDPLKDTAGPSLN